MKWLKTHMMETILGVLCLGLAFYAKGFFSVDNILNVMRNVSMQGVIALGMTMVIIAGEIDLSVGSMVAFAGCVIAWLVQYFAQAGWPMPVALSVACLGGLVLCGVIGSLNGVLRVRFGVPTFISTLGWLTILRGSAGLLTNGYEINSFPAWFNFIGGGYVAGFPVPALIFLFVFGASYFVMTYTTFGRSIYAVGSNPEAARLSGIRVGSVKIAVMAIVALLAGLAGIMQSSQIMSGKHSTAQGWELGVISAVIIGGTSLMGGAGSVWGTLVGLVFLGVLINGMTLLGITEFWQQVVQGGLILIAALLNTAPTQRR